MSQGSGSAHSGHNVVIRTRIKVESSLTDVAVKVMDHVGAEVRRSEDLERVGPLLKSGGVCEGINKDNEKH